jgi:hypothetical protein
MSGSHFYEIKTAFERFGRDCLATAVRWHLPTPNETPMGLVLRMLQEIRLCYLLPRPDDPAASLCLAEIQRPTCQGRLAAGVATETA